MVLTSNYSIWLGSVSTTEEVTSFFKALDVISRTLDIDLAGNGKLVKIQAMDRHNHSDIIMIILLLLLFELEAAKTVRTQSTSIILGKDEWILNEVEAKL